MLNEQQKKDKLKKLAQVAPVLNIDYLDKIFNIKARVLNTNNSLKYTSK